MSADLTGRVAYCGRSRVNDPDRPGHRPLPSPEAREHGFFTYLGPGGDNERQCDVCGMHEEPHLRVTSIAKGAKVIEHTFVPRPPLPWDEYYCGCRGWD